MTEHVVIVPSAPILLPEYAGRIDAGERLRARAVEVVRKALGDGGQPVTLVWASDREPRHTRPALGRRVGEHLCALAGVRDADGVAIDWDASPSACAASGERLAERGGLLVVVADGSARRGEKAPGHLDDRSFGFDTALVAGVRDADAEALLALDPTLAGALLAHGRAAIQVAAGAMRETAGWRCVRCESDDPLGVLYVTAHLTRDPNRP